MFFNLFDKHFHKEHNLNKIFNRNSVKVGYNCTRNIEHIIKDHNRKITESYIEKSAEASCNCKETNICPLEGNCLIKNIVWMATVKTETNTSSYVGMTGNNFKTRYYNHIKSLKNKRYKNETELSKYICKLKEKEVEHTITWKKLRQSNTCQRRSVLCNLCLQEKAEILLNQAKPPMQLNGRFEVSTWRHVSPSTSATSKHIKTEPNRPLHLSEDHRRNRRMWNTVSQSAEVSVTLTIYKHMYIYIYTYKYVPDEGILLPKNRDCAIPHSFELYKYMHENNCILITLIPIYTVEIFLCKSVFLAINEEYYVRRSKRFVNLFIYLRKCLYA